MGALNSHRFQSTHQDWGTAPDLFEQINAWHRIGRDVCATAENAKCPIFWTEADNCLVQDWSPPETGGANFMNPPFVRVGEFVKKAWDERHRSVTLCLIPARTNTRWWHDYCLKGETYFILGRPLFVGAKHGLPQPLAIVIFGLGTGIMGSFRYTAPKKPKRNRIK